MDGDDSEEEYIDEDEQDQDASLHGRGSEKEECLNICIQDETVKLD